MESMEMEEEIQIIASIIKKSQKNISFFKLVEIFFQCLGLRSDWSETLTPCRRRFNCKVLFKLF